MKRILFIASFLTLVIGCSKEKRSDKATEKIQDFVVNISNYARSFDSDFIIIPQNGIELAFNNIEPNEGQNSAYISAINGIGVEELFYNGVYSLDNERLSMLQQLKAVKKIMIAEYITDNNNISDALNKNYNEGFICFTRNSDNYHYKQIPDSVTHSNTTDITDLSLAQNYLYLISTDYYSSKQDLINAISSTNFDVVLIDLLYSHNLKKNSTHISKISRIRDILTLCKIKKRRPIRMT